MNTISLQQGSDFFFFLLFLVIFLIVYFPFCLCSVLIFEVTEPDFVEEEAVRVYVQFGEQTAAEAALLELSGRLFGGRVVRARYFSEARFEKGDLAPKLGEDL